MPNVTPPAAPKIKPKQPQPAAGKKRNNSMAASDLNNIDRVRDLSGQKSQAAETYGKTSGGRLPKTDKSAT